jgi:hypothetical protein
LVTKSIKTVRVHWELEQEINLQASQNICQQEEQVSSSLIHVVRHQALHLLQVCSTVGGNLQLTGGCERTRNNSLGDVLDSIAVANPAHSRLDIFRRAVGISSPSVCGPQDAANKQTNKGVTNANS